MARRSCGMGFPSLGRLPWEAAARGARRWPGKDALSRRAEPHHFSLAGAHGSLGTALSARAGGAPAFGDLLPPARAQGKPGREEPHRGRGARGGGPGTGGAAAPNPASLRASRERLWPTIPSLSSRREGEAGEQPRVPHTGRRGRTAGRRGQQVAPLSGEGGKGPGPRPRRQRRLRREEPGSPPLLPHRGGSGGLGRALHSGLPALPPLGRAEPGSRRRGRGWRAAAAPGGRAGSASGAAPRGGGSALATSRLPCPALPVPSGAAPTARR